jgi:predicted XRE-type DNA-binding protein
MSQSTDGPDIPDKQLSHPFAPGTPLAKMFEKRVSQNRDIVIIVDDFNAGRGTGKSIASLQLGEGMDQTDEGLTKEKCTLDPEALRSYYTDRPKQSALVLDEGEVGASNREAITNVNKALREIMSMGRVEEKYVIINTPLKRFIDTDLQKLADVWISMTARGQGLVHFFKWHPYEEKLMTPKQQYLNFEDIPGNHRLRSVYRYLTREKRRKMNDSDEGEGFIEVSEHNDIVEQEVKQARRETRDDIIARIATHPKFADVSQADIGEVAGVSQSKVSNVLNNR